MEDKLDKNSVNTNESTKGLKRVASDIDQNERPTKRARTDPDVTVGESGLNSLSKDMLTEISYHLDINSINTMFSASKVLRNHISWHGSNTPEFWRQLFQRKYPDYELKLPEDHEEGDTLPWRNIFIGTERKRTFAPKRLQNFMQQACLNPKNGNDAAKLLENTRQILSKLEFQQTLLDQVETFLQKNPSMRTFWDSRVIYRFHQVFAGVEWSVENYKWDLTNTAPVKLTIIGKNGKALFLDLMTSYFACYWGYGLHKFVKHEVDSIFEVVGDMVWNIEPSKKCTENGLMPKTPSDDNDEETIVNKLIEQGWEYFKDESKWKELLDEIGLSDVDPKLFY